MQGVIGYRQIVDLLTTLQLVHICWCHFIKPFWLSFKVPLIYCELHSAQLTYVEIKLHALC